jgi:plasmid stabilization system protein ParE
MPKQLEWSRRALNDADSIFEYYAEAASIHTAELSRLAVREAAGKLAALPVVHRAGKGGTREYVTERFPYTIIYRVTAREIRIVRILHQARSYFNE